MMKNAKCHFDLDLNVKNCKDKARIQFRIKTLKPHIRAELGPLQFAIRNLIGILHYYLGEYIQAYKIFEAILEEDFTNLNAIQNLARVCLKLMNSKKEAELIKRGDELNLANGPSIAIQARFRAEHAYAIVFDVYGTVYDIRRHSISNEIFTECLEKTQNLDFEMRNERALWMLCMVWNYKSWNYKNFSTDSSKLKNEVRYPDILKTLLDIKDLVPDDKYLQCLVWGYLGYFFWKKPLDAEYDVQKRKQMEENAEVPEIVTSNSLNEHFFNPELCFKKSLGILEEIEAMQLYMGWLKSRGRYDEGIELLDKCIQLSNSETNYYSYSKRGELVVERCKQRLRDGTKLSDVQNDLHKSIDDFEFVCQVCPTAYVFGYLGTVCGIASNKGENEDLKARALCAFQCGLDCLGGPQDPWLHFKHARYLNEIGEHDSALDVIHRCMECRHAGNKCPADIEYLLDWHFEKIARCGESSGVLSEMIYWFCEVAFHKYDKTMLQKQFKKFLLTNMDKLSVDFYVQIFLKNDPYLNQFLAAVLREIDVSTALKENFDASILTLMLEKSSPVQQAASLPLKRSDSSQPKNREGFSHDFFVIYSDKDREWVVHSLMNRLENIKNFKGFLDHRDFTPGLTILENIEKAISNSYKSIFVISPNFLNSHWCQHESQAALTSALNKKSRFSVIPIIKDNAKPPDFLTSINHISLEEGLNEHQYERLVKALEG